jgi:hypothetical protein
MFHLTSFEPSSFVLRILKGHPPAAHFVQGLLVWISGRLSFGNALNVVGLAAFLLLTAQLPSLRVNRRLFLTCLLGIPLFVFHTFSGYIDLWTSCGVAVAALACADLLNAWVWKSFGIFLVGLNWSMLSKMTAWPFVSVLAVMVIATLLYAWLKSRLSRKHVAASVFLVLCSLSFWPARNLVLLGSPTYPFAFVLGKAQPGASHTTYAEGSEVIRFNRPQMMAGQPRMWLFVASVFELTRLFAEQKMEWTRDQWGGGPDSPHQRMGGWNGYTMLLLTVGLLYAYGKAHMPKNIFWFFVGLTVIVSLLPQSHELRYWIFLPMIGFYLLCSYLSHAHVMRYVLNIGVMACALVVLSDIKQWREFASVPGPGEFPGEAVRFLRQPHPTRGKPTCIFPENPAQGIWYAGRNFSEVPVKDCSPLNP